jgi:hypothetical protein
MKNARAMLAGILAAISLAAIADEVPGLDSGWMQMLDTHAFKAFYGASTQTAENPFAGTMWNRVDYATDQGGTSSTYRTVVFLVKFRCADHKAAIARMIKYSGNKALVSDVVTPDAKLQWIDMTAESPKDTEAAAVFSAAQSDYETTCEKGE